MKHIHVPLPHLLVAIVLGGVSHIAVDASAAAIPPPPLTAEVVVDDHDKQTQQLRAQLKGKLFCLVTTPGGTTKGKPVRSTVVFFYGTFPILFGIGISLKLATTRSDLGELIANYKYTLVVDAKGSITIC
jgi:hypothetical protein